MSKDQFDRDTGTGGGAADDELARLRRANVELEARLIEAEDTLAAIRDGDVDALIVGEDIYTLDSANAATNAMRKDVLAQMQDAVLAFDVDDHLIFMNPAAEAQYGCDASQMLGRPRADLLRERWPDAPPALHAQQRLDASGSYRAESVHVCNDGREIHVESTVSLLKDARQRPLGSLAVIRNIDERIRTQNEQELVDAALRESKARLEFTLAAARVGDWEIDVESGACRHSDLYDRCFGLDAAPGGWSLEAMLARVDADDRERVRALVERCFATREDLAFECRVTWPDGSTHWIDVHGSAYVSTRSDAGDGGHLRYLGIIADITQRKAIEATLRDADVRKDEFLATLAHELRNPLAPIRNAVQIMQLTRDDARHENARKIIERQLRQMVHLVDDLLDVSRISQGKVELRLEQADVSDVVMTAIETSRPLIDAGRHDLTLKLAPPRALLVDADITRLSQIIANLLNNAAKYTPEGGHIQVSAQREGGQAVISVVDSGIGISREMLPRVFDMFAQVDRSMERAQGGLGIGLALVKRLVEMHGGSVTAASDGPDLGCRFEVRLPLIRDTVRRIEPAAHHELAAEPTNGRRMLVVDDNVDAAESLSQVLQMLGFHTVTAHDGAEALEIVRSWRPSLVLMDIGMPKMNGLEAAREMRKLPGGERLTLIALSGWGQHEDRRRSGDAGFDHHFVKPVDVEALVELIRQLPVR